MNSIGADDVTKDVLARWTDVLEKLETDPMQLERELDWVIKREWIESYMTRNRLSWRDPKISLMDLQYHDIRPDRGIYYRLAARDMVDRITDDETIEQAKHTPAPDHPGPAARRVHPPGQPQGQGLPRRLGLPEAQRPGARDHPLQGPVPVPRRTGRPPDPLLLAHIRRGLSGPSERG